MNKISTFLSSSLFSTYLCFCFVGKSKSKSERITSRTITNFPPQRSSAMPPRRRPQQVDGPNYILCITLKRCLRSRSHKISVRPALYKLPQASHCHTNRVHLVRPTYVSIRIYGSNSQKLRVHSPGSRSQE